MMTQKLTALVVLIAAFATVAPTAAAEHGCDSDVIEIAGQAYVVLMDDGGTAPDIWICIESNGQAGPQLPNVTMLGYPNTCGSSSSPDTCTLF